MLSRAIISGWLPKLGIINFDRSDTIDKYFSSGLSQTILEAAPELNSCEKKFYIKETFFLE